MGAAAPFLGLFGTVCGLIAGVPALAGVPGASLASVAPGGLAEGLQPAAAGLFTAALAVLARHLVSAGLARFSGRLEGFGSEFAVLLSRQGEAPAAEA